MKQFKFYLLFKILVAISLIIVFVGALTVYFVFQQTKDTLLSYQKDYIERLSVEQMREVAQDFSRSRLFVQMIAGRTRVTEFLENPTATRKKELVGIFDDYQKNYPQYLAVYLLDKNGKALISSDRGFVGQDYSFRDYYKMAIKGSDFTETQIGIVTNQLGYFFSSPVYSTDKKKVIGVAVVKLNPKVLAEPLETSALTEKANLMLVNSEGKIFYDRKPKRALLNLKDIGYQPVYDAVNSFSGSSKTIEFFDKADDEEELVVITKITGTTYFLITEASEEQLSAAVISVANSVGIGVFSSAILALLIITIILVKLLSPFNKVREFAKSLGQGNFDQRLTMSNNDEIGELAAILNKVAHDLGELYQNLENKVKLRTADLESTKLAMLNVMEDISDEKQNLVKFKMAVDGTSDHVVITDPEGVILYANKSVEKITGFSPQEVMGQKAGSKVLWGGQMPIEFYKKLWDTIKIKKQPFSGEVVNKRKSGEQYTAFATISPIINDHNEVEFFVGIERDITHEKEIDRAKTEFVSLASHQLRTPLSSINWYTEMLLAGDAGKINEEQKQYLNEVYSGSQRMVDLVNSLLNVSRLELGTFIIEPSPTDLKKLLTDVVQEQQPDIKGRNQIVATKFASKLPKANVDPKLMRIIFQNLLSNAVKYTAKSGKIEILLEKNETDFCLKFKDTGMGIPDIDKQKIFDKLFRARNARNADTSGTGLGLYIVKTIVEQAGGKIWFESQLNKGTTFYVTIPLSGMRAKTGNKVLE